MRGPRLILSALKKEPPGPTFFDLAKIGGVPIIAGLSGRESCRYFRGPQA